MAGSITSITGRNSRSCLKWNNEGREGHSLNGITITSTGDDYLVRGYHHPNPSHAQSCAGVTGLPDTVPSVSCSWPALPVYRYPGSDGMSAVLREMSQCDMGISDSLGIPDYCLTAFESIYNNA